MEHFFATCPRGLEELLAQELAATGAQNLRPVPGGLLFRGDWAVCYRANLSSRLATRILWRLSSASYRPEKGEEDIYRQAREIPWERHFDLSASFRVHTTASRSPLKSIDFVTLRVKDAVCDRFRDASGQRPDVDTADPDVRIQVYLSRQESVLYLDTSGAPLWQRGLRHANVEAPLKENLAAGILQRVGWQPGIPLLDPMCGGGTFVLEAACIALNRPPGLERPRFGFESLKTYQRDLWREIRAQAFASVRENRFLDIWARDSDPRAVRATQANLRNAGLEGVVEVARQDFLDSAPPTTAPGILVANPPYGERIGETEQLQQLYPAMGSVLKRRYPGWLAAILTSDPAFPGLLRLKPRRKTPLFNGALECRLYEIEMVAGSNREKRGTESAGAESV
ncbi:MAG: THUMP domain-containing protein [Zoogloeaceae bacterium]|jgi:putative N6-adenine-specific DNA methylase|nr:THUMP domain-containing protein [Zoogloeaceae bacterium]